MGNNKYKNSFQEGRESEKLFEDLAKKKGFVVTKSTKQQDMRSHIDFFIARDGKQFSFDVKAPKRGKRHTGSQNDEAVWVEFVNVNGYDGWIKGKQTHIAFGFRDSYIIVMRDELLEYVESKIKSKEIVYNVKDSWYRLYQRKGRKDLVTRISKNDLLQINHRIWKYQEQEHLH